MLLKAINGVVNYAYVQLLLHINSLVMCSKTILYN